MTAIEHRATGHASALEQVKSWVRRYCLASLLGTPGAAHTADLVTQAVYADVRAALRSHRAQSPTFEAFVYQAMVWQLRHVERPQPTPAGSALHHLPDHLREVLLLRTAAGLSAEQTARALSLPTEAVMAAQHQALQVLRRFGLPG
ncbi:hypothetical protein Kisp01_28220 [Kineosporia sp. NBRC 101677]|uniref:sigma factor-like helix-turn-helix DNA-binding protein n=1 Tax=Kineosporia sp. NBRC 101677 TaxID=3032197 RepID=UPI0024A042A5|nr:sigma factor-like helix-turn-helix DNA-binding protein [Kineosporia sp. NBRC 101677]GLY15807.1 hypothetical protein Kisp01_28220 [Kineosporia sp. NBRC 101677]